MQADGEADKMGEGAAPSANGKDVDMVEAEEQVLLPTFHGASVHACEALLNWSCSSFESLHRI